MIYGNVANTKLITNLPKGVASRCLATWIATASNPATWATCRRCWQASTAPHQRARVAVKGSLAGDREMIVHAIMLDPLTAAVCTMPQIRAMVEELFAAEAQWLPQFR